MSPKPQINSRKVIPGRFTSVVIPETCRDILSGYCGLQGGFTLIELMVAMTLGLLLMAGLSTLYLNISNTNREMAKTNGLIENGRFAIQLLQEDVVHAGYWGGYVPPFDDLTSTSSPADSVPVSNPTLLLVPGTPREVPDPCLAFSLANWTSRYKDDLIGIPVQGYNIPSPVPSPTVSDCSGVVASPKANTDVLVVRHADTCLPGVGSCEADSITTRKVYFQTSLCETEISAGSLYVLDQTPAASPDTTLFIRKARNCATTADKRKFVSNIYYVRDYSTTAGDGIPTLVRSQFDVVAAGGTPAHQAAVPLIEGIEGFRVEYGLDNLSDSLAAVDYTAAVTWADTSNKTSPTNRGDGNPDTYVRCTPCTATQLANVVSVKLFMLVRNSETTAGYSDTKTYCLGTRNTDGTCPAAVAAAAANDSYKRHVFSTTIRLVNVSARRETP